MLAGEFQSILALFVTRVDLVCALGKVATKSFTVSFLLFPNLYSNSNDSKASAYF